MAAKGKARLLTQQHAQPLRSAARRERGERGDEAAAGEDPVERVRAEPATEHDLDVLERSRDLLEGEIAAIPAFRHERAQLLQQAVVGFFGASSMERLPTERALTEHDVAAIILEPIPHNIGAVLPQPGFLERLREQHLQHRGNDRR